MCGIVGLIDKKNKWSINERENIVKNMLGTLRHRGGDYTGIKTNENLTVGHTRLSIVDTSHLADQPLFDKEGTLVFNGEIYNHQDLREKYLNNKSIKSYSDTVTVFELLKLTLPKKVLDIIHGMFAFSYYNSARNDLILAIDRFSIKPLYYVNTTDFFAYSSEIKAFAKIPDFIFEFNEKCLGEYMLFRSIYGEETLFKNVNKLISGEFLTYDLSKNKFKTNSYYVLNKKADSDLSLEDLLKEGVRKHLMGDFPVGIQLSGGIDSSLIAFWAKEFSQKNLYTFSIGLKDKKWNEFKYSDFVARRLKTKHKKIVFSKKDFAKLFPQVTYLLDEPIVHANTIPMYLLAKAARRYTKVLLTGEGADEVFLGYSRYSNKKYLSLDNLEFFNSFNNFGEVQKLINKKYINLFKRKSFLRKISKLNSLDKESFYDIYTYLPHVLSRQDRAGMGANIENRVPFLYTSIVEKGFSMSNKIGVLGGKTPLKEIALKYLPKSQVLRNKCGFGLPINKWLGDKDALLPYLIRLDKNKFIQKYFNQSLIKKLVQKHLSKEGDNSSILFTLISLMIWHSTFIEKKN